MTTPATQSELLRRYGPWAVVTGASEGIGRAFAERLSAAGFSLVLVARREAALESLASDLRARGSGEVLVLPLDLTAPDAAQRLLDATAQHPVGLLVAAAGFGAGGSFLQLPAPLQRAMVDLNCGVVTELGVGYGQRFAAAGRGGLVLLSSLLAFQGVPRAATYAATKAFVQSLAEGLRLELRPRGVAVLSVAPGPIHSGFGARARMTMSLAQGPDVVARRALAALGRLGTTRPGWLSWLLEGSLMPLPRWLRVRVLALVMRGMTAGLP